MSQEQLRLEYLLEQHLSNDREFSEAYRAYRDLLSHKPQRATHFGMRLSSIRALEETLSKVREASWSWLAGRLGLTAVFRPGDPEAIVDTIVQAFVKTDVFATGLLCLGQHIELQAVV